MEALAAIELMSVDGHLVKVARNGDFDLSGNWTTPHLPDALLGFDLAFIASPVQHCPELSISHAVLQHDRISKLRLGPALLVEMNREAGSVVLLAGQVVGHCDLVQVVAGSLHRRVHKGPRRLLLAPEEGRGPTRGEATLIIQEALRLQMRQLG